MPGVKKHRSPLPFGRNFPASDYDSPYGGRPSALERNVLRYRAIEATLYLFYAEDLRRFMLGNVYRLCQTDTPVGGKPKNEGKKLEQAFTHAIKIGFMTPAEATEIQHLIDYRNDIAHRIHAVLADVSNSYIAIDYSPLARAQYKENAFEKLRRWRITINDRSMQLPAITCSFDGLIFEFSRRIYEQDLSRLERLIDKQIAKEAVAIRSIQAEMDLSATELVGDLAPRFPANHRPGSAVDDDYSPPRGHLTARGAEICYRLYDLGKRPIVVAYLMGISMRAAENRKKGWLKAGGTMRARQEIKRYKFQRPGGE